MVAVQSSGQSTRYRFADLTLDIGLRRVARDGEVLHLGKLTYEMLVALVEAAPNVVPQDRLVQHVWSGRIASPETVTQRVKLLRLALSDEPSHPRYVEVVRGQGYRLIPPVERESETVSPATSEPRIDQSPARPAAPEPVGIREGSPSDLASPRPRRRLAVSALLVATVIGVSVWYARNQEVVAPPQASRSSAPATVKSIAVLPFVDLSPEQDQQYFSDGIAEEILNLLSKATTLRVIARTSSFSFRGKDADVTRIAEALGVTHVLEGSVRQAGDWIRVTVRLVDASDGSRLWSESYDQGVGDILALQTDVARSVAAALKANLQNDVAVAAAKRVNAEAYDLYLRGQQKLRVQAFGEAARYFEKALAIDSEFIPGYYSLGVAYVLQVVDVRVAVAENREKLREVLRRGLHLAPDDPGLIALSGQLARYDGDIQLAEERFATALQKDPSNSVLRIVYPMFKLDQSYPDEALALNRRSLEIDPLNPLTYVNVWASHMDLWNAEEAIAAAEHHREVTVPSDPTADALTASTRSVLSGDFAGSIRDVSRAVARLEPQDKVWLPLLYYVIGDLQTGDALMEPARQTPRNGSNMIAVEAYRHLTHGDIHEARRLALSALTAPKKVWGGADIDVIVVRLAVDALIEQGEARRAVDFLETLAPEYARYKASKDIDPQNFAPAPVPVKSAYSSYPALYFPDYIRALRAVGDEVGADQMLDHLEAILELRRRRGLFIEERYAAEALALRGKTEAALDALEKAERDRTIYRRWHLVLLHNEIFAGFRNHPRFVALVERIQRDLSRQRDELNRIHRGPVSRAEHSTPD